MILAMVNQLWHAVPLVVAISLVYSATRHEEARPILEHSARLAIWITFFMALVAGILYALSSWL